MNIKIAKKWIALAILIVLTPLGILASGTAFGEWGSDELQQMLGYVPIGVEKGEELWHAIFADYSIPGLRDTFFHLSISYMLSAIIGVALIYTATFVIGKSITKKEEKQKSENS